MRFFRSRPALPQLDEATAYARCHGERSEEIVNVEPLPPPLPEPEPTPEPPSTPARDLTGESLRQAFETRLRSRPYFK